MPQDAQWLEPNKCDVTKPDQLSQFQSKLARWKTIASGPDCHSIAQQMCKIAWDDAVYRCFNEAMRINAATGKLPSPATLVELIHNSFFPCQAMAIRRLLDPKPTNTKKAVFSIRSLLAEIKADYSLLTRENYVCYDGTRFEIDSNVDWKIAHTCFVRHKCFDTLSAISAECRSRTDTPMPEIVAQLENELDLAKNLNIYVNKYFTHAAAPENRLSIQTYLSNISLRHLQKVYRMTIWATKTIGKLMDEVILSEVPTPQFDQFHGWENILMRKEDKDRILRCWNKRVRFFDILSTQYWDLNSLYICPYDRARS